MSADREQSLQAEVDRLRLLLQRITTHAKRKTRAMSVELEPAPNGFRMVFCGVSERDEHEMAQMCTDYLNALLKGALRFTLAAMDDWKQGDQQLTCVMEALSTSEEHSIPPTGGA